MAQTVCVLLDEADRSRLIEIAEDRSLPLKHVLRARIVLLSAERRSVLEVAREASVSRTLSPEAIALYTATGQGTRESLR